MSSIVSLRMERDIDNALAAVARFFGFNKASPAVPVSDRVPLTENETGRAARPDAIQGPGTTADDDARTYRLLAALNDVCNERDELRESLRAAREIDAGRVQEIAELQEQLREAQDTIAALNEITTHHYED